jgi:hypothetical protein
MPAEHQGGGREPELRRGPEWAACKRSELCLFLRLCGTRKRCSYSSCLLVKSAPESVVCTRIALPYRKTGTVCSNATQNCISDICPWDRSLQPGRHRNSNNAPGLPCRPCGAFSVRDDPSRLAARPAAVSAPCPFFLVFPASRHPDSRGDRTCDPQTPPSVSRNGL